MCLIIYICATSEQTALYFMYNHFLLTVLNLILNQFLYHFKIPCFIILTSCFIAVNDYFTFFYVKHFELPMCMKCAIQITCLALPIVNKF